MNDSKLPFGVLILGSGDYMNSFEYLNGIPKEAMPAMDWIPGMNHTWYEGKPAIKRFTTEDRKLLMEAILKEQCLTAFPRTIWAMTHPNVLRIPAVSTQTLINNFGNATSALLLFESPQDLKRYLIYKVDTLVSNNLKPKENPDEAFNRFLQDIESIYQCLAILMQHYNLTLNQLKDTEHDLNIESPTMGHLIKKLEAFLNFTNCFSDDLLENHLAGDYNNQCYDNYCTTIKAQEYIGGWYTGTYDLMDESISIDYIYEWFGTKYPEEIAPDLIPYTDFTEYMQKKLNK